MWKVVENWGGEGLGKHQDESESEVEARAQSCDENWASGPWPHFHS